MQNGFPDVVHELASAASDLLSLNRTQGVGELEYEKAEERLESAIARLDEYERELIAEFGR